MKRHLALVLVFTFLISGTGGILLPKEAEAAWSVWNAYPNRTTFSVAAQDTLPQDVQFKSDGTKMYIVGTISASVHEYNLSTAWDPLTASFLQSFVVSGEEAGPTGVFFKPDGTKMYIVGSGGQEVNEYTLSTPWDVSSASFVQLFSVAGQETVPMGIFFRSDGIKMYVVGSTGDDVNEYTLGTAWNISTASFTQVSTAVTQDTVPTGVFFKSDGTRMYVSGGTNRMVNEYSLSSPWSVIPADFIRQFSVAGQETGMRSVTFKDDGTKMYITGSAGQDVTEYRLSSTLTKPPNNLGLVGYWSFNEATSTTATDFSGNGRNGAFSGNGVSWVNGKRGAAVDVAGSNDNINVGTISSLNGTQTMTISVWIYDRAQTANASLVSRYTAGDSSFAFFVGTTGVGGNDDIAFNPDGNLTIFSNTNQHQTNRWEHWVVVYDGTQASNLDRVTLYLNGVEQAESSTGTVGTSVDTSSNVVRIGADSDEAEDFTGSLDEVRIYNRALGPSEVAALYGNGAVPTIASSKTLTQGTTLGAAGGLVGHWSFDGGDTNWTSATAGVAYDRSGTGANGTLTNMERNSDVAPGKLGQALNFDEVNNYVSVADNAAHNFGTTEDFSIALWTRVRTIGGAYAALVGKKLSRATIRPGYLVAFESDGISAYIDDGTDTATAFSAGTINDNAWHHVVVTASRTGNATIYIDGAVNGTPVSLAAIGDLDDAGIPLTIGDIGFEGQPFDGQIDDVRIYSRVLTTSEVRQLYRLGQATILP